MNTDPQEPPPDDTEASEAPAAPRAPVVITMAAAVDKDGQPVTRWQATWPEVEDIVALEADPLINGAIGFGATALEAEADLAAWTVFGTPRDADLIEPLGTLAQRPDVLRAAATRMQRTMNGALNSAQAMNGEASLHMNRTYQMWSAAQLRLKGLIATIEREQAQPAAELSEG
jgi:hypothetical protein